MILIAFLIAVFAPQILGLSLYHWFKNINRFAARLLGILAPSVIAFAFGFLAAFSTNYTEISSPIDRGKDDRGLVMALIVLIFLLPIVHLVISILIHSVDWLKNKDVNFTRLNL